MPPIAVVGRSVLLALLAVEQLGPTLRIAGAQDPLWTPARRRPPAALGARANRGDGSAGHLPPLAAMHGSGAAQGQP
jgi:hypothetical protein